MVNLQSPARQRAGAATPLELSNKWGRDRAPNVSPAFTGGAGWVAKRCSAPPHHRRSGARFCSWFFTTVGSREKFGDSFRFRSANRREPKHGRGEIGWLSPIFSRLLTSRSGWRSPRTVKRIMASPPAQSQGFTPAKKKIARLRRPLQNLRSRLLPNQLRRKGKREENEINPGRTGRRCYCHGRPART